MSLTPCKIITGESAGILINTQNPFALIKANMQSLHEISAAARDRVQRVCFIGSSCMYPDLGVPLLESQLGSGSVYPGNAAYAYVKLLGWQMCEAVSKELGLQYFMVIPSDVFGDPNDSHFFASILAKLHKAKMLNEPKVTMWGTGTAVRHPLFEEDYKKILEALCETYTDTSPVNIAPSILMAKSIREIATDMSRVIGYNGDLEFDGKYPDGQKHKVLDNSKLKSLGHVTFTPWFEAIEASYERFKIAKKNDI